jgi:hypothetical protein
MIVGSKNVNKSELAKCVSSVSKLIDYSDSLVPEYLRYRKEILFNQRYIVALAIREMQSIPYNDRVMLLDRFLRDIYITGVVDRIYDIEDLFDYVDKEEVERIRDNEEK